MFPSLSDVKLYENAMFVFINDLLLSAEAKQRRKSNSKAKSSAKIGAQLLVKGSSYPINSKQYNFGREATFISLPGEPSNLSAITIRPIFEHFEFKEHHLSIDRNFSKSKEFLPPYHYTATYEYENKDNPSKIETLEVHVCYHFNGKVSSVALTKITPSGLESELASHREKIPLTDDLCQLLEDSGKSAKSLWDELIEENNKAYEALEVRYNQSNNELCILMDAFNTLKSDKAPISSKIGELQFVANQILEMVAHIQEEIIHKINEYDDSQEDKRGVFLENISRDITLFIQKAKASVARLKNSATTIAIAIDASADGKVKSTEKTPQDSLTEIISATLTHTQSKDDFKAEIALFAQGIGIGGDRKSKKKQAQKVLSVDEQLALLENYHELSEKLTVFEFDYDVSRDDILWIREKSKAIAQKKLKTDEQLKAIFQRAITEGNIDDVKKLYSYVNDQGNIKEYFESFIQAFINAHEELAARLASIAGYFFQRSQSFRVLIQAQKVSIYRCTVNGEAADLLLLHKCFAEGRLVAFRWFAEQFSPTVALTDKSSPSNLCIFNVMQTLVIDFMINPDIRFIQSLFELGLTLHIDRIEKPFEIIQRNKHGTAQRVGIRSSNDFTAEHLQEFYRIDDAFVLSLRAAHYSTHYSPELILELAKKTTLEQKCIGLAHLFANSNVKSRVICPTDDSEPLFLPNKAICETESAARFQPSGHKVTLLFYPQSEAIFHVFESARLLFERIKAEISAFSPEELDTLINNLLTKTKSKKHTQGLPAGILLVAQLIHCTCLMRSNNRIKDYEFMIKLLCLRGENANNFSRHTGFHLYYQAWQMLNALKVLLHDNAEHLWVIETLSRTLVQDYVVNTKLFITCLEDAGLTLSETEKKQIEQYKSASLGASSFAIFSNSSAISAAQDLSNLESNMR